MAPRPDAVQTDPVPPAETRVVVVGGGIIGVCTAFFLARKGVPVALCEKGMIAGEQSSRNWGWCRKMGRDPREIPLAIEALRLWPEMNTLTGAEVTGAEAVARGALAGIDIADQPRLDGEFRRQLGRVALRRALASAIDRAREGAR